MHWEEPEDFEWTVDNTVATCVLVLGPFVVIAFLVAYAMCS